MGARPVVPMGYSGLFFVLGPMVDPVAGVIMVPRDKLVMDKEIVVAVAVASNPSRREAFT